MSFKIVIPARYASSRLPAKPLLDLGGKPMVVRVAERVADIGADEILIATDHPLVYDAVTAHGWQAAMTREDHPSGTDRIAEVAAIQGWADDTLVVNVQGDEPLIDPESIRKTVADLAQSQALMGTAAHPLHTADEFFNPNVVKVVCTAAGEALYFSRAPIPYARDQFAQDKTCLPAGMPVLRHIGLYAYRVAFLQAYAKLTPSPLEHYEALEQLRVLWHGYQIKVTELASAPAPGVDTPEDAERMRKLFDHRGL